MSRRGGKRKRERPHHDRSYHPDQGAQEQHIADAPRSHGEPRHALPLVFQEPFWGSGWSFGRKQNRLNSSFKLSMWLGSHHFVSSQNPCI